MNLYNISPFYGIFSESHIGFSVHNEFNQIALINEFEKVDGLIHANALYFAMDGTNIEAKIYDDHVELIYSYPWDLCPYACQYRRFWKFKVYYDCSVEFIESFGDEYFPLLSLENEQKFASLKIYPNPVSKQLKFTLTDKSNLIKFEIIDVTGKNIKTVQYSNQNKGVFKNSIDISELKNGLYFRRFSNGQQQVTRKFIKQ
jgi:hypothetical protein